MNQENKVYDIQPFKKKYSNLNEENRIKADLIIDIVCQEFEVSFDSILSRKRKGKIKILIFGICSVILTNKLNFYGNDLEHIFKRSCKFMNASKNKILKLNKAADKHNQILLKIQSIENKLKTQL